MRTVLICQAGAELTQTAMARWLAASSELVGVVLLRDKSGRRWTRIRREARRIGWLRLLDVSAFRIYSRLFLAAKDRQFEQRLLDELCAKYPPVAADLAKLETYSPNSAECVEFLAGLKPDVVIAACKHILKPKVFSIPATGAFALHPGICPEYRNAHGCFWALASNDRENVGTTLLKIDAGIDTGPIYGYFRAPFDEVNDSHATIQRKMTFGNLDRIMEVLKDIHAGRATPLQVAPARHSAEWGQPWLTKYWQWKTTARRQAAKQVSQPGKLV